MQRRRRIRRSLMPTMRDMEVDSPSGDGLNHSKPLSESKRDHGHTNLEQLTNALEKITIKQITKDAKKRTKPKYINTEALLKFKR
jgi:hypothetical protein